MIKKCDLRSVKADDKIKNHKLFTKTDLAFYDFEKNSSQAYAIKGGMVFTGKDAYKVLKANLIDNLPGKQVYEATGVEGDPTSGMYIAYTLVAFRIATKQRGVLANTKGAKRLLKKYIKFVEKRYEPFI